MLFETNLADNNLVDKQGTWTNTMCTNEKLPPVRWPGHWPRERKWHKIAYLCRKLFHLLYSILRFYFFFLYKITSVPLCFEYLLAFPGVMVYLIKMYFIILSFRFCSNRTNNALLFLICNLEKKGFLYILMKMFYNYFMKWSFKLK